jgi:hypothetical protein
MKVCLRANWAAPLWLCQSRQTDIQALGNAVNDAWDTRLSEKKAFNKNVYERLHNVLVMIDDDNKGGNANKVVEENRGKHFRKLEMPDASDESDNEEE